MKLSLIEKSQLQAIANQYYGEISCDASVLAESIRSELSARMTSSRRALCLRVKETLSPISDVTLERIKEVLEDLESHGDVTKGPNGYVASTPLRLVDLGDYRYRVHGSWPSRSLRSSLPVNELVEGVCRFAVIEEGKQDDLFLVVDGLGGLILTPERWAGLDRIFPAGSEWLGNLDLQLSVSPKLHGTYDARIMDSWRAYQPQDEGPQRNRWPANPDDSSSKLWRAKDERNQWLYVWTDGGSPTDSNCLRLFSDQASRTIFSLDAEASNSVMVNIVEDGVLTVLLFDCFLPHAEYRYLITMAEKLERQEGQPSYCYTVRTSVLAKVRQMLKERLQLNFRSKVDE